VVTRRALLAGSAVVLLAGCGEDDEEAAAPASDALLRELAAERALIAATARPPRGLTVLEADKVREISTRARNRAAELAAAVSAEGGRPHDAPELPAERVTPEEAVARAQAAIVAHVVALPSLGGDLRGLGAGMVRGAATDTALLSDALGIPVEDPFPGTPQ
jgi:hypothetical protein